MEHDLDNQLRSELDRRRGDWPQISRAADVSHSWISQFVRGKIPNPGYATLRRLSVALSPDPAASLRATAAAAADLPEARDA